MKEKKLYTAIAFAIILGSCDYISDPIPPINENLGDASSCATPTFTTVAPVKKILFEDYTGHKCTNCPNAARLLHDIDTANHGHIIPLAVHVTQLYAGTGPASGAQAGSYSYDFRTSAGNEYADVFKIASLPNGMINRLNFHETNLTHQKGANVWTNTIANIVNQPPKVSIQIINDFNSSSKKLCTHIKTEFLTPNTGTFNLVVLLVQDSIEAWQLDLGTHNEHYIHRHVLRASITPSEWGDAIANGNIPMSYNKITKFAYNIPDYISNIAVNMPQMHVVAYVYDAATYEVLQAEDEKILP